jgi:hypothetical protein
MHVTKRFMHDTDVNVPLVLITFFNFQIYDWVINFPSQYISMWGFLSYMYDISMGHIVSTSPCSFFIAYANPFII